LESLGKGVWDSRAREWGWGSGWRGRIRGEGEDTESWRATSDERSEREIGGAVGGRGRFVNGSRMPHMHMRMRMHIARS
jgi:hypothetical protein